MNWAVDRLKERNRGLDGKGSYFVNKNGVELALENSSVEDIEPIRNLTFIKRLNLQGCTRFQDLSPIANWKSLDTLNVSETGVRSIEALRDMNVMYLYLAHTDISDLEPISGMTVTEELAVNDTQVGSLEPISNMTSLRYLSCEASRLTSLAPLKSLSLLETVECDPELARKSEELLRNLPSLKRINGKSVADFFGK